MAAIFLNQRRLTRRTVALAIAGMLAFSGGRAWSQTTLTPIQEQIIHYDTDEGRLDPVARLEQRLATGVARLAYDPDRGYLPALLKALNISVASQGLVFSKTSSQRELINPGTPRAIYFGDDAAVGWVPGGALIDLAAVDPKRGLIFYTLEQKPAAPPKFARGADCMSCHLNRRTANVPGWLVHSVYTSPDGTPLAKVEGFVNGHTSALRERWGGWYVTGATLGDSHLGNCFASDPEHPDRIDGSGERNVTSLAGRFDTARYLSPHSDVVALMVLEHQSQMQNLITHANYESRYAQAWPTNEPGGGDSAWRTRRIELAGDLLLEYLLFRNEAPLNGAVVGTSGFTEEFQRLGPKDSKGRSLRQFDLKTRLFRYPCSFAVYSPAFDALPSEMKNYLWRRLEQILAGADQTQMYAAIGSLDRRNVLEILRETKPEFAAWLRGSQK